MEDLVTIPFSTESQIIDKPWEQLPGETDDDYIKFSFYLYQAPGQRNMVKAYREYVLSIKRVLPGEPDIVALWRGNIANNQKGDFQYLSRLFNWPERVARFDLYFARQIAGSKRDTYLHAMEEMIERQKEGWQVIQSVGIQYFYEHNEDGSVKLDENDKPVLRQIDDGPLALRLYKEGVKGERTTRGLPTELWTLPTEQLQSLYQQKVSRLQELTGSDDDTVEAEFEESEEVD